MTHLHHLSALDLAAAIARRDVSVPEVVDHFLDRADHDTVGAFTTVAHAHARAAAVAAQRRLDRTGPAALPRLFGVPVGIKDLEATRGIRTTLGSSLFADWVPDHDDEIVGLLREQGLVDIGKTTTPEFGAACYTEPDVAPPSRSPFAPALSAAGSSGGSAAAVGARLVPLAQGSDTAGSLRSPASACGIVGLKPSRGRVTMGPTAGDGIGLTTKGPLARTVRDTAALLDTMAARPGSGTVRPAPGAGFLEACGEGRRGLVVALAHGSVSGAPEAPEVAAALDGAATALTGLGHHVERLDQPLDDELTSAFTTVFSALAGTKPVPGDAEAALRPVVRHLRARAAVTDSGMLAAALNTLQVRARVWAARYAHADLVLSSTITRLPARVGELRNDADPERELRAMTRFTGNTILANATGFPAISLPLGWTGEGVPIGITLTAGWGQEELLLDAAAQLEEALPWSHRLPPADGRARVRS
ncbi:MULTISPECIES: amidase [unclassified Streptomyces]|uniref:amidase n=1 Tax=unclassified Streptomyces TaxID=2593676 RepID=UPI0036E726CB